MTEMTTLSMDGLHVRLWGYGPTPAVVFHGGPGSGLNPNHTAYFNADRHRVILFDQRGTGLSGEAGSIIANTTQQTLHDADAIRVALGIDSWIVVGGSWGGALALAYAAAYPDHVRGVVVRSSHISRHAQEQWIFNDRADQCAAGRHARNLFLEPLCSTERHNPAAAWFARMEDCREQAQEAARRVNALESAFHGAHPGEVRLDQAVGQADIGRTRVYLWYWLNGFFLPPEGPANPDIIARLPHRLIHGAEDLICPIGAARQFAKQGGLQFYEIPEAGHDGLAPEMVATVRQAVEEIEG
ncbi:MAG: alpha/beta fold hydrolase [Sulfitobacter sp.]